MRLAQWVYVSFTETPMRPFRSSLITASLLSLSLLSSVAITGCAPVANQPGKPGGPTGDPTVPVTYELKRPSLTSVAPTTVALGDVVKVFGKDFIDADHGQVMLHMKGTFRSTAGTTSPWEGDVPLTYVSPGQAKFEFGPSIFFSPSGQDLGTFAGGFQIVNKLTSAAVNAEAGDMEISDPQTLSMVASPSIYLEQMRSVDDNCQLVTTGTTAGSNVAIGVRALGMPKATGATPIHFTFTFTAPSVALAFAENKVFGVWPLTTTPTAMMVAQDGSHSISLDVTNDNAATLDPLHYEQVVNVSPPIMVNQQSTSTVKLARLAAGALMAGQDQSNFNVTVEARAADGTTMVRSIRFDFFNQLEMQATSRQQKDKEVYDLTQTNCSSGGLTGQQYSYSEGSSDSRSRSITMNANTSTTASLDVNAWVLRASASSTQTFGYDVNTSSTTESHTNFTTTINVLPSYVGASYRQPIRSEISVPAVLHNTCGVTTPVGTLVMTNWRWNYDINQGADCGSVAPSKQALTPGVR